MGHESAPQFRTFHALRVKGFADPPLLAEMTALGRPEVEQHLDGLAAEDLVRYREARSVWQLTPVGRSVHLERLEADVAGAPLDALAAWYAEFLAFDGEFKKLCGRWQLRDGRPNDHADADHDRAAIDGLAELHRRAAPTLARFGATLARLEPYAARLATAVDRVRDGDVRMFTGVMCGSCHDIWMELHEDLMLTQRIDRLAEGSA